MDLNKIFSIKNHQIILKKTIYHPGL